MAVTTEGDADSKLHAAALPAQQLQQVLEFLDAAPAEIAGWAGEQADALRAELAARASEDESDDFYAGLENDDDVLRRRPRATGAAKAGAAQASGGRVFTVRFALVVALLAGILGGVWYAARPTGGTPSTPMPTLGTGAGTAAPTEADVLARIAELEATVTANGGDVDARLELGVLYFNQRQIEEAKAQWLAVTELAPDNATAWYNLGFLHLTVEPADMAAARNAWQRVIDIDPESDMAQTASMHLAGLADPATPTPTPTEGR